MARPFDPYATPDTRRRGACPTRRWGRGSAAIRVLAMSITALAALAVAAEEPATGTGAALDQLLRDMAGTTGVSAEFTEEKELALLSAPLESSGRIYFVPPDRFARFTTRPGFSALVIDGERVRFREGEGRDELDLSGNPMTRAFVENFIVLWSGDRERLERLYEVALHFDAERWELSLTPRGAPLDRFIEEVSLRGRGDALEQMIVRERDGDRTATAFRSLQLDRAFSADELDRLFARGMPLEGRVDGR